MPKNKTHSGAKKRFTVTGTGKIRFRRTNRHHQMEAKPSTRARRLKNNGVLAPGDTATAKRLLGL